MEPAAPPPPPPHASVGQAAAEADAQPGAQAAEQQRQAAEQRTHPNAADAQPAPAASRQLAVRGLNTAYLHRYQHYARHLALYLLRHGSTSLVAVLRVSCRLVHTAVTQLRAWAAASKLPRAAALHLARALAALGQLLRLHVGRPLGRLLTQLVWVQVRLSTDDALDDGTRLSARLNSAVSLLFGSVRFRSHSCLQLALPSRQPVLSPEFSLTSPCPSPRRMPLALTGAQHSGSSQQQQHRHSMRRTASSPVPAGSSHGQQQDTAAAAAGGGRNSSSGAAPRHGRSSAFASGFYSSGWPQALGFTSQERASLAHALRMSHHPGAGAAAGSASADAEVHVLCSSELRQAILSFLQAHSQANGSEWVLLRNLGSAASHSSTLSTPRASEDAAGAVEGAAAHAAAAVAAARAVPPTEQADSDGQEAAAAVAGSCCTDPGSGGAAGGSSSSQTSSAGASAASSGRQSAHVFVDAAATSGPITWPDSSSNGDAKLVAELPLVEAVPEEQQQQPEEAVAATELQQALSALGAGKQQQQHQRPPVLARSVTAGAEELRHNSSSIKERARSDAAAAAAAGSEAAAAATSSGAPLQQQDSFTTAADLFRSLAAAAAAAAEAEPRSPGKAPTSAARASTNSIGGSGSPDPCSRPLMSFERGSPARSSSMGSRHVPVPSPAPAVATAAGYMRLFPPGSRSSYEALSLRKSCDNALGTPACHAKTGLAASSSLSVASSSSVAAAAAAGAAAGAAAAGGGGTRKKLPAAPFSLSKSGSLEAPLRPSAASAGGGSEE